jgi:hypothetical protein
MNQIKILEILACFRENRQRLLLDIKHKRAEIFTPMFAYENNCILMELAIEGYFISWINQHFISLEYLAEKFPDNECEASKIFLDKVIHLIQKYIEVKDPTLSTVNGYFIGKLLDDKQKALQSLLDISHKSHESYNQLLLEYEKDKALFRRQMKTLEKQK